MTATVLLADDHKILREGLRTLIEKQKGLRVIAEAETGRSTIALADELQPDIIIMDISMPDINGIEATARILARHPRIRIIGLSMHSDKQFVTKMLAAGASGYLLKHCASDEVIGAIGTILEDRIYLSPKIVGVDLQDFRGPKESAPELTSREREVLQLLAEGHSNKEMASRLGVSDKTVEKHREHIMEKLNLRTIAELTKYAIREGITSVD